MNRADRPWHQHDDKHYPMKTPLHYLVAARQSEIAELEQISRASSLVASMSELVHALQKERGLSNIFLVSGGAQAQQSLLDHGRHVDRSWSGSASRLKSWARGRRARMALACSMRSPMRCKALKPCRCCAVGAMRCS
jgi:hypothetical protein